MKKSKGYLFTRFGGLSKMEQKSRYGLDSYHAPPRKRGIYAFPHGLVEPFLLGATSEPSNKSNKSYWLKDENGDKICSEDFYEKYNAENCSYNITPKYKKLLKKLKIKEKQTHIISNSDDNCENGKQWYIAVYRKPRIFNYCGDLWCHLDTFKPEHIIERNGSWVKVSIEDYKSGLKREKHSMRKQMCECTKSSKYQSNNPFKWFSKDHLEIFIENAN